MIESLKFIFKFIFLEKKLFFTGLFLTVVLSVLTWSGPHVISGLINQGMLDHRTDAIVRSLFMLGGIEIFRLLSQFFSQRNYSILGQNVIERVRSHLICHLLKLPVSYFDRVSSGGMMTRVVNDVNALTDFFQSGLVSVLGNVASLIAIFVGLLSTNFTLGLILLIAFSPFLFICTLFSERLRKAYENVRNRLSELNSILADFLFGMKTIRALGIGKQKHEELQSQIKLYASAQMEMVKSFALFHPTVTLGTGTLILILIHRGYPMVQNGQMTVGDWVAILSYIILIQQPLVEITDRWNFFLGGLTGVNRIREVLDVKTEESGGKIAHEMEKIEFKDVVFQYAGQERAALSHLTFTIARGDWIGVYGESGSGKSTFLQMIYGFYSATHGRLLWNGTNYLDHQIDSIRKTFGVVEQFPFLFVGTIEDNISFFGKFSFDPNGLREQFLSYPLILSLLNQLSFIVNERGENLSMGQRQMITFLRAYVARPQIWILDEATAFFDEGAEKEVLRALEGLRQNQITVIQVAHRPEALKSMSRLVEIRSGDLQERAQVSTDHSPN